MTRENAPSHAAITANDRYTVISADCHAGADVQGYRPYLERRWLEDFDAWAASYQVPYEDLMGDKGARNWDSDRRLADLESDGIVAEVVFPNTVPPFFPKVALTTQPPAADAGDLTRRWAGLQAHNRWLADFCAQSGGRRAGIAQIMLHDIDAAVAEVRWAHENGLRGGVLLPGTPPGSGVPQLHDIDYYDPLWSVCEELRHAGEPPLRQRGAADGPDERRPGHLPARGDVVGTPRADQPASPPVRSSATRICSWSSPSRAPPGSRPSSCGWTTSSTGWAPPSDRRSTSGARPSSPSSR